MAEAAISFVIDKLVELLTEETQLLKGIHKEVVSVKDELESIRSFLRDADSRSAAGGDVKTWVKQVREVAFRIEDIIDSYRLLMAPNPHRLGLLSFLCNVALPIKNLRSRHKIASKIQDVKDSVQKIKERSERYKLNSSENGSSTVSRSVPRHDPRVGSLFMEEAEVVGIESPKDQIIGWLKNGEASRTIIAVVGMGGLGKTTLAKKIHDSQIVTGYFDCHAFIDVSQSYKINELFRKMLNRFHESRKESVSEEINTMDENSLISKLREYLRQKRYFVLFDDVWNIDFWGGLEHALPDNGKGGRIIMTTRNNDVATFCKKSSFVYVHSLRPLSPAKSWELFCKKAFGFEFGGHCPPELENLSLNIVKKCEGLPLAIVAIGGLLSTKNKTISEWQKLQSSFSSELECNPHLSSVDKILFLSYDDLPYYLKSCFLYCGIFPEDYSINCGRLIRLWTAEGFVQHKNDRTAEEVAETYLTELIHRSLVQVTRFDFDGKARSCKVHDLLREIILRRMKDIGFCWMLTKNNSTSEGIMSRRLSINDNVFGNLGSDGNSSIRSLFVFNIDKLPEPFWSKSFTNFKLLKVLDFEDAPLDHIPELVGNLFLLTYLSLRNTKVKKLPKTIGKLLNLETLDLKQSHVYEIPIEVVRLSKLRHLLAYHRDYERGYNFTTDRGVKMHEGVGSLGNLRALHLIELSHGAVNIIKELGMLTRLRKLGIQKLACEYGKAFCSSIERMNYLDSLEISSASEDEIIDLQYITTPPQFLQRLFLKGRLDKLPDWIPKLQNLTRIRIFWARLKDDPLKAFQNLRYLLDLGISYQAYDGEEMHFEAGGFLRLKVLQLRDLKSLRSLIIDKGALPVLEELHIGPCPKLKEVPSGIQHLRKLVTLRFINMEMEFELGIDPIEQKDYWIVEHIPVILLSHKVGFKYAAYDTRKLR